MWCGNDFKLLILGSNQREEYIYIYIYIYIYRERERERERERDANHWKNMSKLQEELIDARKIHIT